MEIGAKMATQQEKTTKKDWPQNPFFFSKRAQDIELLKQVPESSHQTGSFSVSQHIGRLIFTQSVFLRIVQCIRLPWHSFMQTSNIFHSWGMGCLLTN